MVEDRRVWGGGRGPSIQRVLVVLTSAALLACAGATALAKAPPNNPSGFTKSLAMRLRRSAKDISVGIPAPLRLKVQSPSGDHDVYLDQIYALCSRQPDDCEEQVKS